MRKPGFVKQKWDRLKNVFLSVAIISSLAVEPICGCVSSTGNSSVMRRDVVSNLISGQESNKDANNALDAMQRYGPIESAAIVGHVPEYYESSRKLIGELGIRDDASTRLNFAYGIAAVGEGRTRELNQKLGIQFFMRYSKNMLEHIYSTLISSRSTQPLLVIAFNKNDYNGAFYREGLLLEPLTRSYSIILFETDNEVNYYSRIHEISQHYGKIGNLIIGGHGEPGSILLGAANDNGEIDLSDEQELIAERGDFTISPLIILVSCSTGANESAIGGLISRTLEARLFAPVTPSSGTTYNLGPDGLITSVTYNVQTRSFVNGVSY